jgi:fucose permease
MVFVGVGSGILEGLINPLVQETHPRDSGRYLNFVNAFWSIGVLSSVLLAGELLTRGVSWRILVAACGGLAIAAGVLFFLSARHENDQTDGGRKAGMSSSRATFGAVRAILRRRRFWVFAAALFSGGAAEAAFTFWSASYIQLHYRTLARSGGIGTACFAGGMIAGRMLSGHYVHQKGLRNLILISALVGIVIGLSVFLVENLVGFFILLFLAGLSVACFWPSIQSYAADCLRVDATMLLILLSCAGIPGFGAISWIMGIIADRAGIRVSFALIPVCFALLAATILVDATFERRRLRAAAA